MAFIKKYHLFLFLFAWSVINFLQASNTVLLNDEAYYWVYSKFLAWGYFDHPPMIAVLIRAGYFLFQNELGVRFFMVILNTLTLLVLYNLLLVKNAKAFYAILCSIALLQVGGFIAAPDIPLVFFTALFFKAYKNFLTSCSWRNALLLGVVMALLMYSKYHGVLIILCTIASNASLLKNKKAYAAVIISILLFLPHLWWQYQHGFPSLLYHLYERSEPYRTSYSIEYVLGQLLLAGPFMGWLLIYAAVRCPTQNPFERALKFSVTGIYLFFLISAFKGRVEANWTVPAIIPLILLSHLYLSKQQRLRRLLYSSVPFTLAVIFFARFYITSDNKFIAFINTNEFEQDKEWAQKIRNISHSLPVVFTNSYQKASKYWFYSGLPAFSLNTPTYRRNNYNYWPLEQSMQGSTVYVMSGDQSPVFKDSLNTKAGKLMGVTVQHFYSHSGVQLIVKEAPVYAESGKISAKILVKSTGASLDSSTHILLYVLQDETVVGSYLLKPQGNPDATGATLYSTTDRVMLPLGSYNARLALPTCLPGYPSLNSTTIKLEVK